MNIRILVAAPIALAISAAFLGTAATPVAAATIDCTNAPTQLRAAAATAQPDVARKALTTIRTGEALCAGDNRFEAGKKFALAAKALGMDVAQLGIASTASSN